MSDKHTPEPWFYQRQGFSTVYIEARIGGGLLQEIAACGPCQDGTEQQDANARRIVACVNACSGLPTDELEQMPTGGVLNATAELLTQRNQLLVALDKLSARGFFNESSCANAETNADMAEMRAAIAAARGAS